MTGYLRPWHVQRLSLFYVFNSGCHSVQFGVLERMCQYFYFSYCSSEDRKHRNYLTSTEDTAGNKKAWESSKISFKDGNYPINSCTLKSPSLYFLCRPSTFILHPSLNSPPILITRPKFHCFQQKENLLRSNSLSIRAQFS